MSKSLQLRPGILRRCLHREDPTLHKGQHYLHMTALRKKTMSWEFESSRKNMHAWIYMFAQDYNMMIFLLQWCFQCMHDFYMQYVMHEEYMWHPRADVVFWCRFFSLVASESGRCLLMSFFPSQVDGWLQENSLFRKYIMHELCIYMHIHAHEIAWRCMHAGIRKQTLSFDVVFSVVASESGRCLLMSFFPSQVGHGCLQENMSFRQSSLSCAST